MLPDHARALTLRAACWLSQGPLLLQETMRCGGRLLKMVSVTLVPNPL